MRTALLVVIALSACTAAPGDSPDAPTPVDPVGNWNMAYQFALDSCGNPGATVSQVITVTRTATGYDLQSGGASASGTMTCSASSCEMSAVLSWSSNGVDYTQSNNLTLDTADAITGDGSETASNTSATCTATFTVVGARK